MAGMAPESWNKPWPLGGLLFGLLILLLAVIGTFTGKTYGRGASAIRAKDPVNYWIELVVQYLCAAFLIWYFSSALQNQSLGSANVFITTHPWFLRPSFFSLIHIFAAYPISDP